MKTIPASIEHSALFADDAPALRRFYEEALGMRTVVENPGDPPGDFLADSRGNCLEIIGRPAGKPGGDVSQRYICHIAFRVDDVAAAREAIEGRGLTFETETVVDNEEMQTCFFRDPAGNRCQIVWRAKPLS